jgi:hypothetical protein
VIFPLIEPTVDWSMGVVASAGVSEGCSETSVFFPPQLTQKTNARTLKDKKNFRLFIFKTFLKNWNYSQRSTRRAADLTLA